MPCMVAFFNGASLPSTTAATSRSVFSASLKCSGSADLGETSFFGGYKNLRDGISCGSNGNGSSLGRIPANCFIAANNFDSVTVNTQITGSDVTGWYLGLDQELKSAGRCISTPSISTWGPTSTSSPVAMAL